jgi:hypothetical protein
LAKLIIAIWAVFKAVALELGRDTVLIVMAIETIYFLAPVHVIETI